MCQQILQFCSSSTKPLLFAGGLFTLLFALAIGYTGYATNALYAELEPQVAAARSLSYHLQLAAAGYLLLVTGFTCYAAHHDEKHSIRALAGVALLNSALALAAIALLPSGAELSQPFQATLKQAATLYNFADKSALPPQAFTPYTATIERESASFNARAEPLTASNSSSPAAPTQTTSGAAAAAAAAAAASNTNAVSADPPAPASAELTSAAPAPSDSAPQPLNAESATRMWDNLQTRGCCGITNGTLDWPNKIPKSCCAERFADGDSYVCKQIDSSHQQGCLELIGSTSVHLLIVLGFIALINFYIATISGISAYKTYSYSEASQNAYS